MRSVHDEDLYGNAPDHSPVVLLIIDMMNDFEFPGGDKLFEHALPVAQRLAKLRAQATHASIPVVYVNDNFGRWRSDMSAVIEHNVEDDVRARPIARLLKPGPEDYMVLKPKLSGFYYTVLETLLVHLGARRLILTGVATNSCVLFTAGDAYLRDFLVSVPSDLCAAQNVDDHESSIKLVADVLKADTRPSTELDLASMKEKGNRGPVEKP